MAIVSALQISSHRGTAKTLEHILSFEKQIKDSGSELVLMPEATLGGYPKGTHFGTLMGFRTPEGRVEYEEYWKSAISVPGKETDVLAGLSKRTGASLVIGVIEKDGTTLYCTAIFITPQDGYVAKHRKLLPTAMERLVWGQGDGSTLPVVETAAGKVGACICWENYMPLLRATMYAKGIEIYCAPTVDERDNWQYTMRTIATEGRCFVISCCPYVPSPAELGIKVNSWDDNRPLMRGASIIVDPYGEIVAGPLIGEEGLLTAKIDLQEIVRARYDLDVSGHYSRPDVFQLIVDETPKKHYSSK